MPILQNKDYNLYICHSGIQVGYRYGIVDGINIACWVKTAADDILDVFFPENRF